MTIRYCPAVILLRPAGSAGILPAFFSWATLRWERGHPAGILLWPTLCIAVSDHAAKSPLIFRRSYEGAHHAAIVALLSGVQDVQPEIITTLIRSAP